MIFIILLLALILRLINLNQSLWLDEAVQAITAQKSFSYIFEELRGDFHPPLYHILMHFWVRVFGSSEISLRMPSVLCGVGTILVVWEIGKLSRLSYLRKVAALFLATAPYHIYYSQEARMYSMGAFLTSLSMFYFLRLVKKRDVREDLDFFLYLWTTVLALYTDYFAVLAFLAQIFTFLIFLKKDFRQIALKVFLLYLPVFFIFGVQLKTGLEATRNLPNWTNLINLNFLKALPLTFVKFSIGRITFFNQKLYTLIALGILGFFGGIGVYGVYKNYKKDKDFKIILLWFLVPVLGAWIASLVVPNYQPFRLLLILPAFYLLLTYGILAISKRKRYLAAAFVLVINIISLLKYYRNPYFWREDWRRVAQYLEKEDLSIVISSSTFNWPLVYYGVKDKVIGVIEGVKELNEENRIGLIGKIGEMGKNRVAYTPYLGDIYDKEKKIPIWLGEMGFVKMKEISFNQIPIWIYQK